MRNDFLCIGYIQRRARHHLIINGCLHIGDTAQFSVNIIYTHTNTRTARIHANIFLLQTCVTMIRPVGITRTQAHATKRNAQYKYCSTGVPKPVQVCEQYRAVRSYSSFHFAILVSREFSHQFFLTI